jgi:hypothetical protein
VAYHNWFALPERLVPDARAPFVLPEYLKMVLSINVMRNVAQFRIRGHGLKCETGFYGRSPDMSAHVSNVVSHLEYPSFHSNGKHDIFLCMCTEHLRHQFNHDNISDGDIKSLVFQHISEVYKFISAAVDLFD